MRENYIFFLNKLTFDPRKNFHLFENLISEETLYFIKF